MSLDDIIRRSEEAISRCEAARIAPPDYDEEDDDDQPDEEEDDDDDA